jgi:hypothetical protein
VVAVIWRCAECHLPVRLNFPEELGPELSEAINAALAVHMKQH